MWKYDPNSLTHHGIKGQKWGVRRFQNEDGTLTSLGKKRYGVDTIGEGIRSSVGSVIKDGPTKDKPNHYVPGTVIKDGSVGKKSTTSLPFTIERDGRNKKEASGKADKKSSSVKGDSVNKNRTKRKLQRKADRYINKQLEKLDKAAGVPDLERRIRGGIRSLLYEIKNKPSAREKIEDMIDEHFDGLMKKSIGNI